MKKPQTTPINIVPISDEVPEGISNEDAIRQGLATFPKGVDVPIKLKNGDKYDAPSDLALKEILEGRATLYTEEEQKKDFLQKEFGDRPVAAAALGFGRGLTLGLSDVAASALGEGEAVKAIQEFNPAASLVGEIGSIAVPLAGQLGAARLAAKGVQEGATALRIAQGAEVLGAPMFAVSRAGKATSTAVQSLLNNTATGKIVGGIAGGSLEGAIGGAGIMIGQASLEGADTAGEYLSAAIEGASPTALLGGLIGGAIPGAQIAKQKATGAVASLREKVAGFNKEISRKESQAANMLAKNDDPLLILELSTGDYVATPEAKAIQAISDEYGLRTYPEQITLDPKIVGSSQKLLRSTTTPEYKALLIEDANKVTDLASNAITGEVKPLLSITDEAEIAGLAEDTLKRYFDDTLSPFKDRYQEVKDIASNLYIDGEDYVNRFAKYATKQNKVVDRIAQVGGNPLEVPSVAGFLNDLRIQKTLAGTQKVQNNVRDLKRGLEQAGSKGKEYEAIRVLDDYLTDNINQYSAPWKGTGPLKTDKSWQAQFQAGREQLDRYSILKQQVDQDYAIAKTKLEKVKDFIKIRDEDMASVGRLTNYFEKAGKITPEKFLQKVSSVDSKRALEAIEAVPELSQFVKLKKIKDFVLSLQNKAGTKGRVTDAGNQYVDLITLNDAWNDPKKLSKAEKDFLFSPQQQKQIQDALQWNNGFKRAKVTPQKYLTESVGDSVSKAQDASMAGIAGAATGAAVGGASLEGLALGFVGNIVGKKVSQGVQNIVEARRLNKIKGFIGETQEQLSKEAGIIGAFRKSEQKTKGKVKEVVNNLLDNFPENRARLIKTVTPVVFGNKPDETKEQIKKSYKETVNELNEIRGNEQGYLDEALNELGPNKDLLPDVASSYAAQQLKIKQYQLAMMPNSPFGESNSPIAKMWMPSETEMRQFMLVKRASENPMSVLDDIQNGLVSPVSINALRELYPTIYGDITKNIQEKLYSSEKIIGEDQKAVLAIVLGGNFDETFAPSFTSSFSSPSALAPPSVSSPTQNNSQNMKQSGIMKAKFADREQTQTERVSSRS
jgi:hypothetical protein